MKLRFIELAHYALDMVISPSVSFQFGTPCHMIVSLLSILG